jgi:hypothetical protein
LISRATESVKAHGNASLWRFKTTVVAGSVYFLMKERKKRLSMEALEFEDFAGRFLLATPQVR